MAELTVSRLREMLGRETNRAATAERQVRDQAAEITRMRRRVAELESLGIASERAENDQLKQIIQDTLWMACRYVHGRQSYSVGMYNDAARKAVAMGFLRPSNEPRFAIDGSGMRSMCSLTAAEFEQAQAGWSDAGAIQNHCQPDWPFKPVDEPTP